MRLSIPPLFLATLALSRITIAAEQPNVLLIVSEDNGPELSCYGDPYVRTPHLDRLAAAEERTARGRLQAFLENPPTGFAFGLVEGSTDSEEEDE